MLLCYSTERRNSEEGELLSIFIDLCLIIGQPWTCRTERRERRTGLLSTLFFTKCLSSFIYTVCGIIYFILFFKGPQGPPGPPGKVVSVSKHIFYHLLNLLQPNTDNTKEAELHVILRLCSINRLTSQASLKEREERRYCTVPVKEIVCPCTVTYISSYYSYLWPTQSKIHR